jgi:hypothetical protein
MCGRTSTTGKSVTCTLHQKLSDEQTKENKMGGICSRHVVMTNDHKILAGKPEGKKAIEGKRRK